MYPWFHKNADLEKLFYSVWYRLDSALCAGVFFIGSMIASTYLFYRYIWMWAFPALLLIAWCKDLYRKDIPRSRTFRTAVTVIRAVVYTVVIGGAVFPFVLSDHNWKWAYPIERSMFLSNYGEGSILDTLLPEHLPEQADSYSSHFVPGLAQGSAYVNVFYYTDRRTIAEYKAIAAQMNATYYTPDENPDGEIPFEHKWIHVMKDNGAAKADLNGAEVYIFYKGYENTAVWMLNEKTGYFRAYW